jgi:hypothetical protein
MFLAVNMSTPPQTTLAADAHPTERQFLHDEQELGDQQFPKRKGRT